MIVKEERRENEDYAQLHFEICIYDTPLHLAFVITFFFPNFSPPISCFFSGQTGV